jgi:hypothetical protein
VYARLAGTELAAASPESIPDTPVLEVVLNQLGLAPEPGAKRPFRGLRDS